VNSNHTGVATAQKAKRKESHTMMYAIFKGIEAAQKMAHRPAIFVFRDRS